jgi:uncharacterized protein (TIGR02301 family)
MPPRRLVIALCLFACVLGAAAASALAQPAGVQSAQAGVPAATSGPDTGVSAEDSGFDAVQAPAAPGAAPGSAPSEDPAATAPAAPADAAAPAGEAPAVPMTADFDAVVQAVTPRPSGRRARRALSDVGVRDGVDYVGPAAASAADRALIERAQRRERTVDPLMRSQLTQLSRALGAMHALRVSCSGRDDQTWRSRMATLIDLEAPSGGALRDPLVDAFNGGFQAHGSGAASCPADARAQEAALARDGRALALLLAARYRPKALPEAPGDVPASK